jgi:MoaA/NifB/PqqE/SkfB family radical SAM enzyme
MKSANLPDDTRVEDLPGWSDYEVEWERACERCRAEKCATCPDYDACGGEERIERCVVTGGFWKEEE